MPLSCIDRNHVHRPIPQPMGGEKQKILQTWPDPEPLALRSALRSITFFSPGFPFGMRAAFRPLRALTLDSTAIGGGAGCWSTSDVSTRLTSKNSLRRQRSLLGAAKFSSWRPQQLSRHENPFSTTTSPLSAPVKTTGSVKNHTTEQHTREKTVKYLVIFGLLGLGALAFSDKARHAYRAAERSGRVVSTLAVCINE